MTFSLAGLATTDPAEAQRALDRITLAHAIVLGWGGVPVLWMGDEIALPDDPHWADEPGHEEDNRWVHRPRMDWQRAALRSDPASVPGAAYTALRHLIAVRASLPHLHASVAAQVLDPSDPGVLAVLRQHPVGDLLALYNVTDGVRAWPGWRVADLGDRVRDALSGAVFEVGPGRDVILPAYRALWLVAA
jgi:amylosucrase